MENQLQTKGVNFETVLKAAASIPGVKINRESFLRKELSGYFDDLLVEKAIALNPAQAEIGIKIIDKIANSCIAFEATKVTALSTVAGIPGGFAMVGTIPADLAQYFGHILRILQKLVYLYGWQEIFSNNEELNDEMSNQLTLFVGVMFGIRGANIVVAKIAAVAAQNIPKKLVAKALTKGTLYPIIKKIATMIGIKMTKEVFAKTVGKVIPIIGGVVSGGMTAAGFLPMANRLKKYLSTLPLADPEYYKTEHTDDVVDVDFEDINV